jgi:hypothetical protein
MFLSARIGGELVFADEYCLIASDPIDPRTRERRWHPLGNYRHDSDLKRLGFYLQELHKIEF